MTEPETQGADAPPTRFETAVSIGMGGLLLLVAVSLCFWGFRLGFAGLRSPNWPPGLGALLAPIFLASAGVGFGSWRMLVVGLSPQVFGVSLGKAILALFVAAALVGASL